MRARTVLLGFLAGVACGVALTCLLLLESGEPRVVRTPTGTPAAGEVSLPGFATDPSAPTDAPPAPVDDDVPRPVVAAHPALDERVGLVVFGAVTETSGAPVAAAGERIRFLPEEGEPLSARLDEAGAFAVARLRPGTWTVTTDMTGYRPSSRTLLLDGEQPVTRFDFVVEPAARLLVLAFAPDDRPLPDALHETLAGFDPTNNLRLIAVATVEPLADLPAEPGRVWNWFGVGHFVDRVNGRPASATAPGALGWLDVKVPLPVHVSLILGGTVLDSQRVEPGQSEVAFRLAPEAVVARLASLTARFVDAFTQEPLEGVRMSLNMARLGPVNAPSDAAGIAHHEQLLPGRVSLTAEREGYEMLSTDIQLAAGQHTDLGDVLLSPATTVTGLVLDAQGGPLAVSLRVTVIDAPGPLAIDLSSWLWESGDDGRFALGPLGRRRYVVRVEDETLISPPVVVDARGGDVSGLVLRAERGQPVSLRFDWAPTIQHGVRVLATDAGVWDERITCRSPSVWTSRLPRGRYTAECFDGATVLQSVPFEVTDAPVSLTLTGP